MKARTWIDTVNELLKHIRARRPALAVAARLNEKTVWRYLQAGRQPTPDALRSISRAMAELTRCRAVEKYLNVLGALEWGVPLDESDRRTLGIYENPVDESDIRLALIPVREVVISALRYFCRTGYKEWTSGEIASMSATKMNRLDTAILEYYWKACIREIDGEVPKLLAVDEILAIFQKHGIRLESWLLPVAEQRAVRRIWEFKKVVTEALSEVASRPDPPVRLEQEIRINAAFDEIMSEMADEQVAFAESTAAVIEARANH